MAMRALYFIMMITMSKASIFKSTLFIAKSTSNFTTNTSNSTEFKVIRDEIVYRGWRNIAQRDIQQPNGHISTYDIVIQNHSSVGVFVWNTHTSTTTLVKEYHPGVGKSQYGIIGGMYEKYKHRNALECAQFELEEESHLSSSTWIPLLQPISSSSSSADITDTHSVDGGSVSFDKYSNNILHPYLALNCDKVENPRLHDEDEFITIEYNVTYQRLIELLTTGQMNVFSSYVTLLALKKLEDMNIFIDKSK